MSITPEQLSRELRLDQSPDMARRRWIVGLSMVGVVAAKLVSLYQTGVLKTLPDPPIAVFDSPKVDASNYAYKRMQTPDGLLMLVTYGITASLAGAGGARRAETQPLLPVAMGAKLAYDVFTAFRLAGEEWAENKALCAYCQAATVASVASLIIAVPEVRRAVEQLLAGTRAKETLV